MAGFHCILKSGDTYVDSHTSTLIDQLRNLSNVYIQFILGLYCDDIKSFCIFDSSVLFLF